VLRGIACVPVALSAAAGCTAAPSSDAPGAAAVGTASSDQALSSAFAVTMASLAPVGWWRLGETTGSAADSSGNGHIGTYHNFLSTQRGIAGAIAGDSDGAIQVTPVASPSCANSPFVDVADNDSVSLTQAQDSFDRSVALGSTWGTADHGGGWTAEVTTGSFYSVDGSHALIAETTAGTWQIGLPVSRKDADIQVRASWSQAAVGGALTPLAIVARRIDNANAYRAEIRENPGGQLDLRIVKLVAGTSTVLQTATAIGTYSLHGAGTADDDWWYVRFQLEGTSLRARAWKFGTPEPTTWTVTATDSSLTAAGNVSIRSANSGTTSLPTVAFEGFRVQSVGMTVHAFMKPTALDFNGGNYVHWLGKGEDPQMEWGFRFYPSSDPDRPKRVSGYIWNPTACCGFSTNEGAGAYFQDPALAAGTWYEVVVVYDPGDDLDTQAGVTIYQDGQCESGTRCGGTPSPGVLYSNASFVVYPLNGTSPLRIGTRDCGSFFTGGLDEVAVFDRRLTAAEISDLHTQAQ
jgi:Concanavalin A-like lectin/glucanases superfamily